MMDHRKKTYAQLAAYAARRGDYDEAVRLYDRAQLEAGMIGEHARAKYLRERMIYMEYLAGINHFDDLTEWLKSAAPEVLAEIEAAITYSEQWAKRD